MAQHVRVENKTQQNKYIYHMNELRGEVEYEEGNIVLNGYIK